MLQLFDTEASTSSNKLSKEENASVERRKEERCRRNTCQTGQRITNDPRHFATSICTVLFILHILLIKSADACMPGYEGERARLRQYLGIEWSPGGLAKMDAEQPRFVRYSNELNCDFSNPANCKWQNVHGLDSLDFYLFRKEDNTEFPLLQIRPGPSKVPVGDQLLLVGDRKRQEQSAILISHPIKCQNSTGRLTFTFWLYNGARVEVLMFEERDGNFIPLPEKPLVDCGTVQVNTECTVPIPPREQPFRIGIRAYDIRHPEGSFVMLDNLLYEAQFCRVSIDFGPNFHTEPLLTAANGEFVQTAAELSCSNFDGNCHWRNLGHGEKGIWQKATGGQLPTMMLFNETGTNVEPILPAAFFYIEEGGPAPASPQSDSLLDSNKADALYRMLVSDPIQCPTAQPIVLQFRVWSTKGIKMSCCMLEPKTMRMISCQPVPIGLAPAPVQHQFQPIEGITEYMFAIRVDFVNTDFDNFVILDELELIGANSCGQFGVEAANRGWLSSGGLYTAPMFSALLNRPVHSAKDLTCDFSKRALNCQWANLEQLAEGMSYWEIGILGNDKLTKNTRNLLPDGDVALTRLDTRNSSAVLLSEQIQCTLDREGNGGISALTLRSWHSGDAQLGVCIVRANSLEVLDCQSVQASADENYDGEQIMVEIPRLDEPVRLALRAESTSEKGGLVAVDDLQFEGNVCASSPNAIAFAARSYGRGAGIQQDSGISNPGSNRGGETVGWHTLPDENVCRLLKCSFETEGNMCLYSSSRVASSVSMFRVYNHSAFAMLFTRSRVAMLESPLFHLNAPARLHFDFAISKGHANLHICQDSVMRELDSCFAVFTRGETAGWQHDFIEVLPTDRKLYLIAKLDGPGKASVQLDNLELTDVRDHRVC